MTLKEMPKVGDKVRYIGDAEQFYGDLLTPNAIYEVDRLDEYGDALIVADDGDRMDITAEVDFEHFELVTEGADNMTTYTAEQRQARKGERIVIVEPNVHDSENYERGDTFTVDKVDSAGVVTTTGNIVYHEEYEVLPAAMAYADRGDDDEYGGMVAREMRAAWPTVEEAAANVAKASRLLSDGLSERDNVNNPAHYAQGKYETIDIIAQIVGGYDDPFVGHCVGTAVKYVSRAPYKHDTPLEDMRKSKRYIEFAIERLEGER